MTRIKQISALFLAVWIRYSLRFSAYYKQFSKRVEISTPVNGWNRVVEGIRLKDANISPYSGDTFHETPLFLNFYELLFKLLNEFQIGLLFIFIDILTAFILSEVVSKQIHIRKNIEQKILIDSIKNNEKLDFKSLSKTLLMQQDEKSSKFLSLFIYLLSPYSILACVGQSTSVFSNCIFALTFLSATNGFRFISCYLLSLLSINSLYPIILLPAVILILVQNSCCNQRTNQNEIAIEEKFVRLSILLNVAIFVTFVAMNSFICNILEPSESYLDSVYGFVLKIEELTPNIGLFWYFFTEMFDHFREFFIWVFQINTFIFVIPLTVRFWRDPFFLSLTLLFIHSLFKPYPSFSDFVLYLSLLPQWSHLFKYMKSILVVSVIFSLITVFLPIQWYLWIDLGTANANFYFGMTLAYNIAQIFLITDLMFAFVKREFFFNNLFLYQMSQKLNKNIQVQLEQ